MSLRIAIVMVVFASTAPIGSASDPMRTVEDIVLANNRIHSEAEIKAVMAIKPGMPCDDKAIQADVARLMATKWFLEGGVKILTKAAGDDQVIVYVFVSEAPTKP